MFIPRSAIGELLILSPSLAFTCGARSAHPHTTSFVGYLEEEAVKTYTDILAAVDNGIPDLRRACQLQLSL